MTHPALIERITRSLAYMLRHQPERFDLTLDPYGWGELPDVVRALNEKLGESVSEEDLREAVRSGDRPRYEIEDDRVRALYGHSIDVQPGEPSKPPEFLYVGVASRDADRALRYGLRGGRRRFLHLARSIDEAREAGRRTGPRYSVLTVFALDAWEEGIDFYDRHALFLAEEIPTQFIEVQETGEDGYEVPVHEHEGRRAQGRGGREGRGPGRGRGRGRDQGEEESRGRGRRGGRSRRGGERREEGREEPRHAEAPREDRGSPREERGGDPGRGDRRREQPEPVHRSAHRERPERGDRGRRDEGQRDERRRDERQRDERQRDERQRGGGGGGRGHEPAEPVVAVAASRPAPGPQFGLGIFDEPAAPPRPEPAGVARPEPEPEPEPAPEPPPTAARERAPEPEKADEGPTFGAGI